MLYRRLCLCLMLCLLPVCALADVFLPSEHTCSKPDCFWETPMNINDTEAVWAMLTQPMTVVKGDSRTQAYLLAEPHDKAERVAEVTCSTQGVHVLETLEDGWSRVECYSSSFSGSKVKAWNQLTAGYIRTDKLEQIAVKQTYGLVVDKLDQRLYIFEKGELLDVLAVSTGFVTKGAPYNETRSGEYILNSRTGTFMSGNMTCDMGIRFNDGDLIHEVPHLLQEDGKKNYWYCERYLGEKASHGCIRVQRLPTPKGINMEWLWDHLRGEMGTRIVIWEDWPGRTIDYPDDDTPVYYNPKGGQNYHAAETCNGVRNEFLPLTAFPYGELDMEPYDKLTPCEYCVPPRRVQEIMELNLDSLTKSAIN